MNSSRAKVLWAPSSLIPDLEEGGVPENFAHLLLYSRFSRFLFSLWVPYVFGSILFSGGNSHYLCGFFEEKKREHRTGFT